MADVKISQLPASTTPLDGTEVLPIVQSATTKQVSVANLTAGRAVSALSMTLTNALPVTSGGTGINTADQGALLSATGANTFSATRTPTLGLAGTAAGTLGLSGSSSGVVTLNTAAAAGTWSLTLPTSGGTNGYILTTNGSGVTSWTNPTALGVDLDVGTTAITGGTSGRVLYNNAGVLGEYAVTGTGSVVLGTSPTFTTSLTSPLVIGGTAASSSLTLQSTSGVGTSDSILFKVGNNGATTAATIDSAGNLGLGVTPVVRLDVSSGSVSLATNFNSTNASGVYIRFTNSGTAIGDIGSGASLVSGGTAGDFGITSRSGNLILGTNSAEKMRIDTSGNLLVGTTSLAYSSHRLTVSGGEQFLNKVTTINSSTAVTIANGGCGFAYIRDASNGNSAFIIFEFGTVNIISQVGSTFVTTAPGANEIRLTSLSVSPFGLQALAGASRNNAALRVSCITPQ